MESCHKLPLEDSRGRVPRPRFGGECRERPADGAAAEPFDSVAGTRHDPRRWGLAAAAMGPVGERLYECWRRLRRGFKTCTRDPSGRASDSLRGQLPMDGARNCATLARHLTGDDGQAWPHVLAHAPWAGPGVGPQLQAALRAPPALAPGRTLLVAERAEEKAGTHHAGASRQYNGRMGQVEGWRVAPCLPSAKATVGRWARGDGARCWPPEG
jgi:hypothetical protein